MIESSGVLTSLDEKRRIGGNGEESCSGVEFSALDVIGIFLVESAVLYVSERGLDQIYVKLRRSTIGKCFCASRRMQWVAYRQLLSKFVRPDDGFRRFGRDDSPMIILGFGWKLDKSSTVHPKDEEEARMGISSLQCVRHLRDQRVLNGSNLSIEMMEGFREGISAWRGLKSYMEEGDKPKDKEAEGCPFSASSTDPAGEVQIPCGLVVDSSATVIATVTPGGSGNFKFELVGAKAPGEFGVPPVILHYNVRILGDKITDQAVIIQNTWTRATDWGEEERCPYMEELEEEKKKQVDGLDICIEQVGKTMTWKPQGENVSKAGRWSSVFKGSEKPKTWFPFAEGMPFAATLWVGWEGFHMTVNGKHISSFEYRKGLEPWLVNKLEVSGDLKTSSIIATGLPTSERVEEVAVLEFFKAPPLPPKSRMLKLFVGVFSTTNNFDRRMAVRRTWMQSEEVRSSSVVVRFFVGLHKQKQVNKEVLDEAKTYGDIQLLPFVDYYDLITLKTIAICIYASQHLSAEYVMKTDDDTFVRIDAVLSAIKNRRSHTTKSLLLGAVETKAGPSRDTSSKWYISEQEYAEPVYPPWAHGPGYIISSDIAKFVSQMSGQQGLKFFKLEDVAMGIWIEKYRRQHRRGIEYLDNQKFVSAGCEDNYVIAHYQNPRQMLCLWQELKTKGTPVCCD
ncbi:hypothetical protein R1flu_026695 [Riccia fluitans]|uniref:Galectin domain-containing protein n=1 Tax=Riccia fluitans TaxID=41844 RepID=A0ABD1XGN7_9MARC